MRINSVGKQIRKIAKACTSENYKIREAIMGHKRNLSGVELVLTTLINRDCARLRL
jgi:hypothetical protein